MPGTLQEYNNLTSFNCAGYYTPLELFDTITNNYEVIARWNAEIKDFLAKERVKPAFEVIL